MPEAVSQTVYQTTVMAKVLDAASAMVAIHLCVRQRIEAFISRDNRCDHCHADQSPVSSLVKDADDTLFESVLTNQEHIQGDPKIVKCQVS